MKKRSWLLGVLALTGVMAIVWLNRFGQPEDFASIESQFKYGSIGADHPLAAAPIPYWMWKVLPELFPPAQTMDPRVAPRSQQSGFGAFGLVTEDVMPTPMNAAAGVTALERPIGFSTRKVFGVSFVGPNCAFCHVTTLRRSPGQKVELVLGGTGNSINIEQYFLFMFAAFESERFTPDIVMEAIINEARRQNKQLTFAERMLYRYVFIPAFPGLLREVKKNFDFIAVNSPTRLTDFGPGRVDTWALYKRVFVSPPQREAVAGIADFPPIFNQKPRVGMRMHWDGNTEVLEERNLVSALALIGPKLEFVDFERMKRLTEWTMTLQAPRYEDRVPPEYVAGASEQARAALRDKGETLFERECAQCHAATGSRIGKVETQEDLGTDPGRMKDFTPELAAALNRLGTGEWQLRNFSPQRGYVNTMLDGVWLRAPYLHNGSVPSLRELLNEPERRPQKFCRGDPLFDWEKVGFVSELANSDNGCGEYSLYDTALPGNGNAGHRYGTTLKDDEKEALVEFLKRMQ